MPPFIVPGWQRIFASLLDLRIDYLFVSMARVLVALTLSFAIGMICALAMFRWTSAERLIMPVVRLLMAVPATIWIICSVLWFKFVELRIGFVLVVVCTPIFIVDFLDGMRAISKDLHDMARSFRPSPTQYVTKLVLPAITPIVFTSCKINLGQAIRLVTFAELVGAVSGIGYGLVVAENNFAMADVFAWAIVLIVVLHLAMVGLEKLEAYVLRWRVAHHA